MQEVPSIVSLEAEPSADAKASEKQRAMIKRLHFAMATRWHDEDAHAHYTEPSVDRLCFWLSHCIGYIRNEIQRFGN